MPTILTFGDSNTHGTPPLTVRGVYERIGSGTRWPTVMAKDLGPDWTLVEEGLPGRTTCFPDPVMGAHMDARPALRMALESHGPIDVLTIMLGTNDTKAMFGVTPEAICGGLASLISITEMPELQARHGGFRTLIICPPPVKIAGVLAGEFFGGDTKSRALPALYKALADHRNCGFLNAGDHIEVSALDGVHYEPASHVTLGHAVAKAVTALVG